MAADTYDITRDAMCDSVKTFLTATKVATLQAYTGKICIPIAVDSVVATAGDYAANDIIFSNIAFEEC